MGIRISCLVHGLLLLLVSGCSAHRPVAAPAAPDLQVENAKEFAQAVANKMPMWDADAISRYERAEIAAVKADIVMTLEEDEKGPLLDDAARLHDDWDALVALDEMLKHESLI